MTWLFKWFSTSLVYFSFWLTFKFFVRKQASLRIFSFNICSKNAVLSVVKTGSGIARHRQCVLRNLTRCVPRRTMIYSPFLWGIWEKNYLLSWSTSLFPFLFSLKYPLVYVKHSKAIFEGVGGLKNRKGDNLHAQINKNIRVTYRANPIPRV